MEARGEAMAVRRYPGESVGDAGSRKEKDKDFQGLVGRGLQYALLKTDMMTFRGQPANLSSAISAMFKQLTREAGKNVDITAACSHHFLPPHSSECAVIKAEKSNTVSWI